MGFLTPKVPKQDPPPNPQIAAVDADSADPTAGLASRANSLIGTAAKGLKRKASTQRTSLIGG